jgi:hypothetical protein
MRIGKHKQTNKAEKKITVQNKTKKNRQPSTRYAMDIYN